MPLNSSIFNVQSLTQAINNLPSVPSIIRDLGLFTPEYLTTTFVNVERRDNHLALVANRARGDMGEGVSQTRYPPEAFNCLHLPKHDIVLADDVQNVRGFGTTSAETVAGKINDKMTLMKTEIDMTREHLMLGALLGKVLDADGTQLVDIYQRFGLTRAVHTLKKSDGMLKAFDVVKVAMQKATAGDMGNGFIVLASPDFMQEVKHDQALKDVYLRFQEANAYRDDKGHLEFSHAGIDFVNYVHDFGTKGAKIKDGEAIILPKSARFTLREYFAPANMNSTVNSRALAYYASLEKLKHDTGWDLYAQSNPLPLLLRPQSVATLKLGA